MSAKIDAFIAEVRTSPEFVAASAADSQYPDHLDNIACGLSEVDRQADSDPKMIAIFDNIQDVIVRNDLSLKQRLLELGKLLTQVRDVDGTRH
jgi:hypothetical protein